MLRRLSPRLVPSTLVAALVLATCAPPTDEETLVDEFQVESEDALQPALSCVGAPVCTTSQVVPQCLAASLEAGFGFEAYQTINVPASATYSFVTVVLKRFYTRTNGNFVAELREFLPGSTAIESSVFLTSASLPGVLLPRNHAAVTLRFDNPTTLAPALGATPRYVLLFKVTGGTSLSVGIGCAQSPTDLPGLTSGGHKLLKSGGNYVSQEWRKGRRPVALALGNAPSGFGTCLSTPGATCDDGNATAGDGCSASCQVESGFTCTNLPSTCTNSDDCAGNGCLNGAACVDGVNAYTCACAAGYAGTFCATNINECAPNPCQNGGTCTDGINAFTCACAAGYSGATCATNINECSPNPCANGGTCTDGINAFTCACAAGYTGATCATNINECSPNPCANGGTCTDGINAFTCACAAGYSGATCETNINECSPNPCLNGGTCTDGINAFTCACAAGYSGATCATNINECSPNPCQNGGTCTDGINAFTCACATGYTGATCTACATGYAAHGTTCNPPILFEDFNTRVGGTTGTQCTTGATVYHSASYANWTKAGTNTAHVLLRSVGNHAAQFFDTNVLTLTTGVAANVSGRHYRLEFASSPTAWNDCGQTTPSGNTLLIEVLRANDTVLASFTHGPGAWAGASSFNAASFGYDGDGSGNVRVRISDPTSDVRFAGAVDDVGLYLCPSGKAGPACALTAQTITFAQPAAGYLADTSATLTASSTSGLTVSFASSTTPVCTVSGSTVSFVGIGTCTITASQAGNGTYAAATSVVRSFNVNGVAASGGTESTINVGGLNYRVHKFTTTGQTFSVTKGGNAEYLAIGGGGAGGGGYNHCGGGGAGGYKEGTYPLNGNQGYIINVGAGGTPNGGSGTLSGFGSVQALGGGGGCQGANAAGTAGGSGGGGCEQNAAGGLGSSGQGNNGGQGSEQAPGVQDSGSGGGGGAGGAGGRSNGNAPGGGGAGIQRDITGTMTWYAAGGSGSAYYAGGSTAGIGGSAPGVNGGSSATAGAANTGSGGGGGRAAQQGVATSSTGGAGGSGVVIIRYRIP